MRDIEKALARCSPSLISRDGMREAAVAMILRDRPEGPEVMFIQRAESKNDPWSGQIAFPGGSLESGDSSLADAAIRETREETGAVLTHGLQIGRLDDLQGSSRNRPINLVIGCFVYRLDFEPVLVPNYEVADIFWTPLALLRDESRRMGYLTPFREEPYPAIHLGTARLGADRILWGLTYRFVRDFLGITAH
ncbi:MAG: CoA pyrophosphatase [Gammaproteobacteria bacterium]|nr:CoA pyrophosphatase [Gammaproteobacteria bacterium]